MDIINHYAKMKDNLIANKLFSAVVGNPPYQSSNVENENVQNIFHDSQELSLLISNYSSMIYPAGRWIMRSGKGMRVFGDYLLNNPRLHSVKYFDTKETLSIFPGTLIRDGVGIVFSVPETIGNSESFELNGECVMRPGSSLISVDVQTTLIVQKLREKFPQSIRDGILSRGYFGIESPFAELNSNKLVQVSEDTCAPKHMIDPIKLFTNDKSGASGRAKWFWVERSVIPKGHQEIERWKVITRSGIQGHERKIDFLIVPPGTAIGRSYVVVRSFMNEGEALGFMSYLQTRFAKFMIEASMVGRLTTLGSFLPDLSSEQNPRTNLMGWRSDWKDSDLKTLFKGIITTSFWERIDQS